MTTHRLTFELTQKGRFWARLDGVGYEIRQANHWSDWIARTFEPEDASEGEVQGEFHSLGSAKERLREIAQEKRHGRSI